VNSKAEMKSEPARKGRGADENQHHDEM